MAFVDDGRMLFEFGNLCYA